MSRRFRLSLVPFLTMLAASCSSTPDNGVEVIEPEVQDVSRPLSELAKIPVFTEAVGERGHEAEPARAIPRMRKDDGARLREVTGRQVLRAPVRAHLQLGIIDTADVLRLPAPRAETATRWWVGR